MHGGGRGARNPESPCELDDGRIVFANTYASRIDVCDPATGVTAPYGLVGGSPNACVVGADRFIHSDAERRTLGPV